MNNSYSHGRDYCFSITRKKNQRISKKQRTKATQVYFDSYTLWIAFEFIGLIVGVLIFGEDSLLIYLVGFGSAALGAFLAYNIAKSAKGKNIDFGKQIEDFGK
ncbi:MAG: hypothetical protein GY827_05485 [Cytophagales bacterium]|nr:hypothetical protein [Cytophagales bacterium]